MTAAIIITISVLLLVAYLFDITSSKTRIPSVILLLALGWLIKEAAFLLKITIPDLSFALPLLGTVGLILIVLDGSLDLELDRSKTKIITKHFLGATFSIAALTAIFAWLFMYYGASDLRVSILNAIPISIISSAIAIPSTKMMCKRNREFAVYDTSFSDVIGVVIFSYIMMNYSFTTKSMAYFGFQIVLMILISITASAGLSYLLGRMRHQIKFVPIILLVILIYSIAEMYHLPALIFILLFGLTIGNMDKIVELPWIKKFVYGSIEKEVIRFREITSEATFLIRSLFFLVFGFLIETDDILDTHSLQLALIIIGIIIAVRAIQLKLTGNKLLPLLFIVPRGLITILLFLSIAVEDQIGFINRNLILQIIVLTTLVMILGTTSVKKEKREIQNEN
jgi:Kef-type K+ transport system membrane component KefB